VAVLPVTRVLGLVPARGGSKGVPGKNLRPLAGASLIEYAARAGQASGVLDRIVLSTDSPAIAEAGRRAGLDVPFLRPPELAADDTPMLAVIRHALAELDASGWHAEAVVLLQPTSPLRTPAHVREAVTALRDTGADSVVTVVEVPRHLSPDYVMRIEAGVLRPFLPGGARITRRQDARPAFAREGTVYACWRRTIDAFGDIYGADCRPLLVDPAQSLSIDSAADWAEAERRLAETRRTGVGDLSARAPATVEGAPTGNDS
jgi:CMP-N-acetylneuraminic acid synthetase